MPVTIRGSGQVPVQVITATSSTVVTNNTTSYASTGLTASITPTNSANKVLVTVTLPIVFGSSNVLVAGIRISRGGTIVYSTVVGNSVTAIVQQFVVNGISFLDSPATTSSTTYTIEFATLTASNRFGNTAVMDQSNGTNTGTLMLQEISGT
jgi:uncharacterized Zn-binding protein involved in type VI secretion